MKFTGKQTAAYGIGAVGKDMMYALSATYVMYYYQDLLGLPAAFVGLILMLARIFDALNDPFMGILVAKTRSRFGRFVPWLMSGSVLNALVSYAMFAAPRTQGSALMVYFAVIYTLWGVTYTMMDIPFWSMIPAVTEEPKDRERLSVVGRTCAGVGFAIVQMGTLMAVQFLGGGSERAGFARAALLVSALFILSQLVVSLFIREKQSGRVETTTVREMFRSLIQNNQAMVTVLTILFINSALYITSNLVIYFFKYDLGGANWKADYTLFTTVGGAAQILGMMGLYPLLRKRLSNPAVFKISLGMAGFGYALLLALTLSGLAGSLPLLCLCGASIFAANGMQSVLTTVFLSSTADWGEYQTGRREESVIFSMQTFVVKAASGFSVFISGLGLSLIGLSGDTAETGAIAAQSASTILGLRLLMTILPSLGLIAAFVFFSRRFRLTDTETERIAAELKARRLGNASK